MVAKRFGAQFAHTIKQRPRANCGCQPSPPDGNKARFKVLKVRCLAGAVEVPYLGRLADRQRMTANGKLLGHSQQNWNAACATKCLDLASK